MSEVTEPRVRRALVALAYVVTTHGPAYAPIFERIEREHAVFLAGADVMSRAERVLAAGTIEVKKIDGERT